MATLVTKKNRETPAVKRLFRLGWTWQMKHGGTPHLVLDGPTLCGRHLDGLEPYQGSLIGCFSCHDRAWEAWEKEAAR